jgi:DnaJ-class molecular chaperone
MSLRTRQELAEETQCPRCAGSGVAESQMRYGPMDCSHCSGSGLVRVPKFRVTCECGERQPRFASSHTAGKWMRDHLRSHAPEEPEE